MRDEAQPQTTFPLLFQPLSPLRQHAANGATHGVYNAAKLNDSSITGALHHTPVMHGDCRVNQIATDRPQPRQCPILVGASKSAVSDNVRNQDRYELPGFDHGTLCALLL